MKYVDLTLPTAAENLACDETLLDLCETGWEGEILRFWEPTGHFVVLGYANRADTEVNLPACKERKIGIFRRASGGGAVLQGPGCLNYSLILQVPGAGPLSTITGANQFIMERQRSVLTRLVNGPVAVQGHTDLTFKGLKFSGNAQRRKRTVLIFHGTFLLNFDLALIEKALRMPTKQPDYRAARAHRDFLTNLNLAPEIVKDALRLAWSAAKPVDSVPLGAISELAKKKYATDEWNLKF